MIRSFALRVLVVITGLVVWFGRGAVLLALLGDAASRTSEREPEVRLAAVAGGEQRSSEVTEASMSRSKAPPKARQDLERVLHFYDDMATVVRRNKTDCDAMADTLAAVVARGIPGGASDIRLSPEDVPDQLRESAHARVRNFNEALAEVLPSCSETIARELAGVAYIEEQMAAH